MTLFAEVLLDCSNSHHCRFCDGPPLIGREHCDGVLLLLPPLLLLLTGNGGFVGATGTEIHTGEVAAKENVPYVFPSVRLVFFCLVDVDGNPYDKNICLEEVVGNLDIGVIKEYVGKGDWDIAEIK